MIKYIFIFLLLLISCKEIETRETKGYYIDENHYEVIAFGRAPEEVKNPVKARNMAREAALIEAQKKVNEEFNVPVEKIVNSGLIKKSEFVDENTCRIVYAVNAAALKKE